MSALSILPPDAAVAPPAPGVLEIPLSADSGVRLALLRVELAEPDPASASRLAPAIECLRQELAGTDAAARAIDLKLLRLANELDIDFADDPRLEKALAAVARRTGAEVAWLSAPRCRLTVQAASREQELDRGVTLELARLAERVAQLQGQLRRPLAINGPGARPDRSAECRLLLVPLFIGRTRHPAWLVLLAPLAMPPIGGWQMLPALTLGQALARRLEIELDRRTGLYNRGGLESAMRRLPEGKACLILLDIDRLHAVNQMNGLAAGDEAIMSMANLLAPPVVPANALVARITGGTFAVLLPDLELEAAAGIATVIQTAAESIRPGQSKDESPLTLSCGVAEMQSVRASFDKVAVDADFVLKLAKERGRSRVELHVDENSSIMRRHGEVVAAADLREALRTRAAVLFAQKIVSLEDRRTTGFELLLRMRDNEGQFIPPGEFIAAAQRYQLLTALDRYVIEQAFELLAPHRSLLSRLPASVSINVSGQSIGDEAYVDHFVSCLRASRIPPGLIMVEVTEQAAVTNLALAEKMMRRLREVGCGIALDDFGTGANSLAYLRSLPVSRIKIDGSFVRDLMVNPRSEAAVRGVLQLSRGFKVDTVAEYVETEQIAQRLRSLGVDKGQGHLFGKPEPLADALQTLADGEFAELRDMLHNG